ncbi:MAG: hypothetical protein Kapaf2KO_21300 [Candidatus Kapaibacteriales bacterium]
MTTSIVYNPKVALFIDQSLSMLLDSEGNRSQKDDYLVAVRNLSSEIDGLETSSIGFGDNLYEIDLESDYLSDSLLYESTSISSAIDYTVDLFRSENIRAAVILSDGNSNSGSSPVVAASKSRLPFYTIGFGDTTRIQDIKLSNIKIPSRAKVGDIVPISTEVEWSGVPEKEYRLVLTSDNSIIDEKSIKVSGTKGTSIVNMLMYADTIGLKNLSISIDTFSNEKNKVNNAFERLLKVEPNESSIALFSGAPTADLRFLLNQIQSKKGTTIQKFIQRKGSDFYVAPTDKNLKDIGILVLNNFPISTTSDESLKLISEKLAAGTSMLFMAGPQTDYRKLKQLGRYLPFEVVQHNSREYPVSVDPANGITSKSLFSIEGKSISPKEWKNLPPITKTETYIKLTQGAEAVASSMVGSMSSNDGLISVKNSSRTNVLAIMGYDLYNWKLKDYALGKSIGSEGYDFYSGFIANLFSYLEANKNTNNVNIELSKNEFSPNEDISFDISVKDKSGNPINDASVDVTITSTDYKQEYKATGKGLGRYVLALPSFSPAQYTVSATASFDNTLIGKDIEGFKVLDIPIEYRTTGLNDELLKSISDVSSGKYYLHSQLSGLKNEIENHPAFKSRSEEKRSIEKIYLWPWLLIVVLVLFSLEWFFRKRFGLL